MVKTKRIGGNVRAVEIDRTSWHFKVYRWVQDPFMIFDRWDAPSAKQLENRAKEPAGICGYFWTVALGPFVAVYTMLMLSALALAVGIIVLPFWLVYRVAKWSAKSVRAHPSVIEPVSLAATYVAARKARVCPRVVVK